MHQLFVPLIDQTQQQNTNIYIYYILNFAFIHRVYDKKPGPVDMSKLLSFGYAGNGKSTASTDVSSMYGIPLFPTHSYTFKRKI